MEKPYDAVVIGSGQGGKPLAIELANRGKKTLLVEKEHIGGTCINRGCTPTKAMVASAKAIYEANRTHLFGVLGKDHTVDMAAVRERKQKIVDSFRQSSLNVIKKTKGLDLIFGTARFVDQNHLEILDNSGKNHAISANLFFINTGCRPRIPPIDGINSVPYLNSTTIMELEDLPLHLVVIGGGYISLEFSQMFRRFGSKVTILEQSERLLKREDPDVSEKLKEILLEDGIDIQFNSNIKNVACDEQNNIIVNGEIKGSHLLVATGRIPNTEDLRFEAAGIDQDKKGFIRVNEKLQTSVSHIYAIGDVKGGPAFTHISYDDYLIIRDNLLFNGDRTIKDRLIPYTIYTDPQLGRVGLTEEEAKKAGIPHKVAKMPMSYVARAIEIDETRGFMKAIVHAETGQILGCTILGVEGGELMSMLEIAMMGKLPYQKLRDAIFAHPTFAEALNNLFGKI